MTKFLPTSVVHEPIYEYVRGIGWIINPPDIITLACGTRVRYEIRVPKEGERFSQVSLPNDTWFYEGKPLQKWLKAVAGWRFDNCNVFPQNYVERYCQMVLVPV